jgi:hypothetical protein
LLRNCKIEALETDLHKSKPKQKIDDAADKKLPAKWGVASGAVKNGKETKQDLNWSNPLEELVENLSKRAKRGDLGMASV